MKKKCNLKSLLCLAFILVCFVGVLYYSFQILMWISHVDENKKIESEFKQAVSVVELTIDSADTKEALQVDFDLLKSMNPDTVAYLNVFDTSIDYPVVRGNDNDYYLKHNFEKQWNVAGWVFADYKNKFDGSDKNIVVYAHNMTDGSMFGSLKLVLNSEWRENAKNKLIYFVTENGMGSYQVFSTYIIDPEEKYIQTSFQNDEEFASFIEVMKSRSSFDYGVEVSAKDHILTLSTCTFNGDQRVVLHARKME